MTDAQPERLHTLQSAVARIVKLEAQLDKAVTVLEKCGRCICVCGQTCAAALAEIRETNSNNNGIICPHCLKYFRAGQRMAKIREEVNDAAN